MICLNFFPVFRLVGRKQNGSNLNDPGYSKNGVETLRILKIL